AHLGDDDGVGPGLGDGPQVVVVPGRADPVGPDRQLLRPVLARVHRCADPVPGLRLGVGGDGVLEVEDQRVGGDRLGLLQRPLVGAGHVEDGAAGAVGLVGHRDQPSAVSKPYRFASSGSRAARRSASSSITRHCFTEASSSIFPWSITAPVPSPMASTTSLAWATSAGSGENTRLAMSIWTGWRLQAPTQPSRYALRNWSSQATVSLMSPKGP